MNQAGERAAVPMVRRRNQAVTPVDNMTGDEWVADGAWAQEEPGADGSDNTCRFRLDANLLQLASELREDASSPFFGMFKTKSALYRHIMTRGLIAMGETYRATRGSAQSLRLKEEVLASALASRTERKRMSTAVEATIRAVGEAMDDGRTKAAADTLDRFFEGILPWEEETRKHYAVTLLTHPAFSRLKDDWVLREASGYLKEFTEEYVK